MRKPAIPLHKDELNNIGLKLCTIGGLMKMAQTAHRDDHYMFIIQRKGYFLWELDFSEIRLEGPSICFVAPGQVHRYLDFGHSEGWFVFADTHLVPGQCREIFETSLHACQMATLEAADPVFNIIPVLEDILVRTSLPLQETLIASLTETLAGMVASALLSSQSLPGIAGSHKYHIVTHFRKLVAAHSRSIKQVKDYAALLNISPLYLNEVVKAVTGFQASYWIAQELLLEAKRLLHYTMLDVRQIAYELGYEDHAYFSRFFKKHTGMTALEFRHSKPSFVQS